MDARLNYPASWRVAQAAPTPEMSDQEMSDSAEGREDEPHRVSASELNRQLSNPITDLGWLQFQFNTTASRTASGTTTCCSSGSA